MSVSSNETNKIKEYCIKNDLNFDLLADMERNFGIDMIRFEKTIHGKKQVILEVCGYGDNLIFKQTEYTKQYLGMQPTNK